MTSEPSFLKLTNSRIRTVEDLIRGQSEGFHPGIKEALEILLSSGGKRLRPVITLLVGDILGAPQEKLLRLAGAIELLHTATLVHDDLLDASLLRRGSPTLNAKWSPGATVLTGDFLFARAAYLATLADSIQANRMFAETLSRIVDGELIQMLAREFSFSLADYYKRIESKTAALFQTSAAIPGLIVDAELRVQQAISQYGYHIGIAFQILDDILDFTSDAETLGKPVGNDLRQGIITMPVIYFAETHPDSYPPEKIAAILAAHNSPELPKLIEQIIASDAIAYAGELAEAHTSKALAQLQELPKSDQTAALHDLASYVTARKL